MNDGPTVLVVGATGFVGAHIARRLDRKGFAVRATRRESSPTFHLQDVDIEWVQADLNEPETLDDAVAGCAAVIHAAGYYPDDATAVDAALKEGMTQLRNLFDACLAHRIGRAVYISSPATLGIGTGEDDILDEDDFYLPGAVDDAYFEVKHAMEAEVYRYLRLGLGIVIVIPSAIFGPGDVGPTTGEFLLYLARGRLPGFVGRWLNAVDVRDVADSTTVALERGRPGRRYILGGENLSVDEFVARASRVASVSPPRYHLPTGPVRTAALLYERGRKRLGLGLPPLLVGLDLVANARRLDDQRARAELGHHSRSLAATLDDAFGWFQTHNYL